MADLVRLAGLVREAVARPEARRELVVPALLCEQRVQPAGAGDGVGRDQAEEPGSIGGGMGVAAARGGIVDERQGPR